ncbi:hypothetical protein KM043_006463 [Ampulex compressa]|nr:hypothetical protein KM043_006463 [Ampulex compressa]
MSAAELNPAPVRVSPLIKFGRWSFLTMGIIYGSIRYNRLSKKENARREAELKLKPARDAKLAEEKRLQNEADIRMIEEWSIKK